MIDFLKRIKEIADIDCEIGEYDLEKTFTYPYLLLTPISEKWEQNLLGNVTDKKIRVKMSLFLENNDNYENIAQEGIEKLKSLLLNEYVKKDIITFISADVQLSLIDEQTVLCAVLDTNLEISRR